MGSLFVCLLVGLSQCPAFRDVRIRNNEAPQRERDKERERHGEGTARTDRGLQGWTAGAHRPCGLISLPPLDIARHRQSFSLQPTLTRPGQPPPAGHLSSYLLG